MGESETTPFGTIEEYYSELTALGKRWIGTYCAYAVDQTPEGEIRAIKGKLLFKRELEQLCTQTLSEETKEQYEEEVAGFIREMKHMHAKSRNTIAGGEVIPLEYLYWAFGFGEFEWFMICMAYMVETDAQFERVFALLQDDFGKKIPTIDLCVRMYTFYEHRRYELVTNVVERWELLGQFFSEGFTAKNENMGRESVLSIPLKLDTRIIRFIYDVTSVDECIREEVEIHLPTERTNPMLIGADRVQVLEKMYQRAVGQGFVYVSGEHGIGKKYLVQHFCKEIRTPLMLVDARLLMKSEENMAELVKRLVRESVLKGNAIICIANLEFEDPEREFENIVPLLRCFEKQHVTPIFTSTVKWKEATPTGGLRCMELVMEPTTQEERGVMWDALLKENKLKKKVDTERLAGTYRLPPGAIKRVINEVEVGLMLGQDELPLEKQLYAGCQRQLVHSLGKDAVRIAAQYTMEELVLPVSQKQMLNQACDMVRYHHKVFDKWGFHKKMAYGKGVSMIFYGPPGTGKTMGAQAIANELNLELYRVDMASVLSKYVGESEKKLGNIFEQGEKSQSILFFDEADALFGKRSEVKDSQDKYANASTAFLLQKLEEYRGVIILATNLLQNFDSAFCRRFHFIIEFPFPDIARREEIWRMVFPDELPKEELDYTYLAEQFVLSGSQIKNIAVAAAFLAAGEGNELEMVHVLRCIKREMKKTGKNMISSDFGVYYSLMEQVEGE